MVFIAFCSGALYAQAPTAAAQPEKSEPASIVEKSPLRFGVFVDTYYAASVNLPSSPDRQYLTQVARDREFNINLAHVEAVLDDARVRGRLAIQYGTSVMANYQAESTTGKYSNRESVRNIQEAFAGYKFFNALWLDAGIFFGNIGFENWISHANWNYTRALNAENTPYYASGIRFSWDATAKLQLQLLIVNGWQEITPINRDPALGTKISYEFNTKWRLTYNTFAGNVMPESQTPQYRFYNNLILEYSPFSDLKFAASANAGLQQNASGSGFTNWYAGTLYAHWIITTQFSATLRLEYFYDPKQIILLTSTENGYQVGGITAGFDYRPEKIYVLRFEYRNFFSRDSIYNHRDQARPQEHIFAVAASLKI
ncbi:MAG: porin [Turneriella sp.]|nr:porin [Turneriella sp.]